MRAVSSVDCSLNDFERTFVEAYCPCREISICDIGSSTGREAIALHGMGFHHVWPIDRDAGMVVVAHRRAADQRIGLPVTRACAEALPFSDRSFDVVLMTCNLYGYIPSHALRVQALREVHRVLKPGGLAFLAVTSRYRSWRVRAVTWLLDFSGHPQSWASGTRQPSRPAATLAAGRQPPHDPLVPPARGARRRCPGRAPGRLLLHAQGLPEGPTRQRHFPGTGRAGFSMSCAARQTDASGV